MIEVPVGENDGIDRICRHGKRLPIEQPQLLLALEQAAFPYGPGDLLSALCGPCPVHGERIIPMKNGRTVARRSQPAQEAMAGAFQVLTAPKPR